MPRPTAFHPGPTELLPPGSRKPAPKKSRRRRKKSISQRLWLFLGLAILILGCANGMAFWLLWTSMREEGLAGGMRGIIGAPTSAYFSLPEPSLTPGPTPTATRVVLYLPTATDTPTAMPTPLPTATPPPVSVPVLAPTATPVSMEVKHVVIISIDGLRPDALESANAPNLDKLIAQGAYSRSAQTVSVSETLPGHASMLSGMVPEKHGIVWGLPYIGWSGMNGPTLFNVAHDAGLSTAMVFGKEKMNYLVLPNSVDKLFGADVHDLEVKDRAVAMIQAGLPDVLFIHFPDVDRVGHAYGWMSSNQLLAVTYADSLIGEIMAEIEKGGYLNSTFLIVTADHGGHDRAHGNDSPEDRTIPWLAVGPGVRPGIILTRVINTYDTAATVLYVLKLPQPERWDGRPVMDIFSGT